MGFEIDSLDDLLHMARHVAESAREALNFNRAVFDKTSVSGWKGGEVGFEFPDAHGPAMHFDISGREYTCTQKREQDRQFHGHTPDTIRHQIGVHKKQRRA
ncbi:MAG: hypothetical protein M3Y57_06440 [Acidobacteriota bacterium]|nr:hypothetical protein [Acidobacteriota bacterium]